MPTSRLLWRAAALAVLLTLALYLLLTEGLEAVRSTEVEAEGGPGNVPQFVYDPPETVPTTEDYGPVGAVSVVFAGGEVRTGLTGRLDNPWIAVSSRTGAYRALSAPHLPDAGPGAVSVSPDGRTLAWGFEDGVVLYDPVADRARVLPGVVDGSPVVGDFSADGRWLLVHDGELRVFDAEAGEVAGTVVGAPGNAARQAVWDPSGERVTYVDDGELVLHSWVDDARTSYPTSIRPDATIAWAPTGGQIAAMRDVRGVRTVEVLDVTDRGLRTASTVEYDGYAQQELLGFTGESRVTVTALTMETATIPLVFNMSTTDSFPPTRVMQLPGAERVVATLAVAADPLAEGSVEFDEPSWPASNLAKLTASVVITVFVVGMWLTRRPRDKKGAAAEAPSREIVGV